MKTAALAALLLTTAPAWGQTQPPTPPAPPKGANVILIQTTDSAVVAYRKMAALLLGAGYTLDRADKDLLFMNTKSRHAPKLNMVHILNAAVVPGAAGVVVRLKDSFTLSGLSGSGESETAYRGMAGSPFMVCWNEMQRVAALYPGAKLTYVKQP